MVSLLTPSFSKQNWFSESLNIILKQSFIIIVSRTYYMKSLSVIYCNHISLWSAVKAIRGRIIVGDSRTVSCAQESTQENNNMETFISYNIKDMKFAITYCGDA